MAMRDEPPSSPSTAPTVAIIGCGPGGMFFLHVVEKRRRELAAKGDQEGLAALPIATCFERAPTAGGVWRAERSFRNNQENEGNEENEQPYEELLNDKASDNNINKNTGSSSSSSCMYEALWTNGAIFNTEFYDYTYEEHFGRSVPVNMPRRAILNYIMARVTRHAPRLLVDHVKFNTTVLRVEYVESLSKFEVTTKNKFTRQIRRGYFDKCIWAAGDNGKPRIPKDLNAVFTTFTGQVVHSSAASALDQHVRNKRVLMVGGSYSAEDLALMAIKLGVDKIYISFRSPYAWVKETSLWPQDKVELLECTVPSRATKRCIQLASTSKDYNVNRYTTGDTVKTTVDNIDTVILCTGYEMNYTMLAENLQPPSQPTELDDCSIPSDWSMTSNEFTPEVGSIPVAKVDYHASQSYVKPGLYRGVLMSNPNMMFCNGDRGEEPLLETDICIHSFFCYISGRTKLPCTAKEMAQINHWQFQQEFQVPWYRYYMDPGYRKAIDALGSRHWMYDKQDARYQSLYDKYYIYPWLVTCLHAKDGHYPVDIGSFEQGKLSDVGKRYYENASNSSWLRKLPDFDESEKDWRTFRDYNEQHAQHFVSVFTGAKAVPLKSRWLDIDENDEEVQEW